MPESNKQLYREEIAHFLYMNVTNISQSDAMVVFDYYAKKHQIDYAELSVTAYLYALSALLSLCKKVDAGTIIIADGKLYFQMQ